MKKLKKKVLGIACLVIVAAMTMIAHTLPRPNVSAVSSITDTIVVTVYDKYANVTINNANEDGIITDPYFEFDYDFSSTRKIYFTLTKDDDTIIDEWQEDNLDYMVPGHNTHLSNLPDFGEYTLSWLAVGAAPGLQSEDSLSFKRCATKVVYVGTTKDNEPVFDIYYINDVENIDIQIYTSSGNPLFDPALRFPDSTDLRYRQINPEGAL